MADVKSLAIHPASTTHSQLTGDELLEQGIKPNTIRLSIGTEHIDDILFDLEEAFKAVKAEDEPEEKKEKKGFFSKFKK